MKIESDIAVVERTLSDALCVSGTVPCYAAF